MTDALTRLADAVEAGPFIAVDGQYFATEQHWINKASSWLTSHPQYRNTEHEGPSKGWRGPHFTALCFDQDGKRLRNGGDFAMAKYPVWWVWPDQIAELVMASGIAHSSIRALAQVQR